MELADRVLDSVAEKRELRWEAWAESVSELASDLIHRGRGFGGATLLTKSEARALAELRFAYNPGTPGRFLTLRGLR